MGIFVYILNDKGYTIALLRIKMGFTFQGLIVRDFSGILFQRFYFKIFLDLILIFVPFHRSSLTSDYLAVQLESMNRRQ